MSTKPDTDTGWTNKFTSAIGYYFVRERGEDTADASIIEYQGDQRAYISGADDNFWNEWTSGRFEFLGPFTASDFEQLIQLRQAAWNAMEWMSWWVESEGADLPDGLPSTPVILAALREALAQTGEQS